ncbi:MAG: hypothetical protein D6683_15595 [Actinomyces sp.]|nr:MAG: hypothetical protein D6683_15595 [Actinomyces sp.]
MGNVGLRSHLGLGGDFGDDETLTNVRIDEHTGEIVVTVTRGDEVIEERRLAPEEGRPSG